MVSILGIAFALRARGFSTWLVTRGLGPLSLVLADLEPTSGPDLELLTKSPAPLSGATTGGELPRGEPEVRSLSVAELRIVYDIYRGIYICIYIYIYLYMCVCIYVYTYITCK